MYKSYAITLRFRHGITDGDILNVKAALSKHKTIGYVEKEGTERHLHAAVLCERPVRIDNVKRMIKARQTTFLQGWQWKIALCVKPMYNGDWAKKYIVKDGAAPVFSESWPEGDLSAYYAPKNDKQMKRVGPAKNRFLVKWAPLCLEWLTTARLEISRRHVYEYLITVWRADLLDMPSNMRRCEDVAWQLHMYMTGTIGCGMHRFDSTCCRRCSTC